MSFALQLATLVLVPAACAIRARSKGRDAAMWGIVGFLWALTWFGVAWLGGVAISLAVLAAVPDLPWLSVAACAALWPLSFLPAALITQSSRPRSTRRSTNRARSRSTSSRA